MGYLIETNILTNLKSIRMAYREENEAVAAQLAPERPVPAPRPRRTIIDIATFSGKDKEDITEWLIKWDIAATANGWTDQHQLQMLPAYLSGRAARTFWKIPHETRQDLESMKEALEDLFNTEEKRFLARQKLQETTQGSRESVMDFAERIDCLVVKGHDGLDDGERRDRIACEQFIKGLRHEIKETVWEKCPQSFQEAITAAERREVYLNSMGKKSRVNEISEDVMATIQRFNEDRAKSNEEIWKAIQNLTSAVQNLAAQSAQSAAPYPEFQSAQRGRGTCFRCNQPGHIKRNCPQNSNQNPTRNRSQIKIQNQSQSQSQHQYQPQHRSRTNPIADGAIYPNENQLS